MRISTQPNALSTMQTALGMQLDNREWQPIKPDGTASSSYFFNSYSILCIGITLQQAHAERLQNEGVFQKKIN
jgi:hypothetical protein